MKNVIERVILFNIAFPIILLSIFLPLKSHLLLIVIFGFFITILGSYEISILIINKGIKINKYYLVAINFFIYVFAYFYANNIFDIHRFRFLLPLFCLTVIIAICFFYATDVFKKELSRSFEKIGFLLFGLIYIGMPSFCLPFLLNINFEPVQPVPLFLLIDSQGTLTGSFFVLFLIVLIWSNDIFAWLFGILFGHNNVIGLTASPKKSWAGYIGGYFSPFILVLLFYLLFNRFLELPLLFYLFPPLLTGFLVPIGDLVESVIKRSVNVKDSGNIILGRGGVLDSVDTLLFLIPLYFAALQVYFSIIAL